MRFFSLGQWRSIGLGLALAIFAVPTHGQLIDVEEDTGKFYSISTADSAMQLIDSTGITGLGALEFNPHDGFFYGFTTGASPSLYRFTVPPTLDHVTSELVGPLGFFAFEGGVGVFTGRYGLRRQRRRHCAVPSHVELEHRTGDGRPFLRGTT